MTNPAADRVADKLLGIGRYRCSGNCGWSSDDPNAADEIRDLWGRVSAGELMPWGECPECGALVDCPDDQIPSYTIDAVVELPKALGPMLDFLRAKGYEIKEPTP